MERPEYEKLLSVSSVRALDAPAALDFLGTLIDLAHGRRDAIGAEHAVKLATDLPVDEWTSPQRAEFYYFISNAWSDLRNRRAKTLGQAWEWVSPEFEHSLLALRQASNEPGFSELPE